MTQDLWVRIHWCHFIVEKTEWEKWSDLPPVPMGMNRSVDRSLPSPALKGWFPRPQKETGQGCQAPYKVPYPGRNSRLQYDHREANMTQFPQPDSPTSNCPHLHPHPTHTHPSQGLVSELPSWPQSELLTSVPDEQARLWLESQNVLPHSFQDLTYSLLLTCWGKSPWPLQQVYRKVTIS